MRCDVFPSRMILWLTRGLSLEADSGDEEELGMREGTAAEVEREVTEMEGIEMGALGTEGLGKEET